MRIARLRPVWLKASSCLLGLLLLGMDSPGLHARSYSSGGGRSYSSSSSRSSGGSSFRSSGSSSGSRSSSSSSSRSSGSSAKPYTSSSGKSYSSSSRSDDNRHSYSSGKSYSADSGNSFSSRKPSPGGLNFDASAARARKEEASKQEFTRYKDATSPKPPVMDPVPTTTTRSSGRWAYTPDRGTILSRPIRSYPVFYPYLSRPVVVYHDPYNSFFWWWLLDRALDDRAYWAYHHRYDMDPARYQALIAKDQQLEDRVAQLEAQGVPRNPNYTPPGLDRDLMYSDQHVTQAYHNRSTASGRIAFWIIAIPLAGAAGCFLVWLVFFKRWQPATAT